MHLLLKDDLPFVSVTVAYQGRRLHISDILVDTGSASTILAADQVVHIDLVPEPTDVLKLIQGVGGTEAVFTRHVDHLQVDEQQLRGFEIEVGGLDYGFAINGILGMDFLTQTRAVIDLSKGQLYFEP
ncbi:MAG: retropepsin-like domain-containing protein [Chloroflexi bacterium]|nr:retropepsin-like domain-containing protein [Chloroflexota bacterium]